MSAREINRDVDFVQLAMELWKNVHTQVQISGVLSMQGMANDVLMNEVEGDIVEVGVWEGGCVAFLAKLFEKTDRTVWAVDSYEGFQPPESSTYNYPGERHTPSLHQHLAGSVYIRYAPSLQVSLQRVKNNLGHYGINEKSNVKYLKGFANEVLEPSNCPIEKIALLRIDVDAYSATKEVLEALYDKVVPGGYIIFDDWGVTEAQAAIEEFFLERGIDHKNSFQFPVSTPEPRYPYIKKIDN